MTLPDDPIDRAKAVREMEVKAAWDAILSDRQGRLVVWDILEQCGVYRSTFTGNAHGTFLEGQRQIGRSLDQLARHHGNLVITGRVQKIVWALPVFACERFRGHGFECLHEKPFVVRRDK